MKKLIINADDFGLSRSINSGIIKLFKNGALTSCSLLVNMPGFEDAVRLIKENHLLGVGVHINVLRGKPVSCLRNVKSLCKGEFFRGSIFDLLALRAIDKRILNEFAIECRSQIEKAVSKGIQITHVDSEKHIHIIKPFFQILLKVAQEFGISKIRSINELPYLKYNELKFPYIFSPCKQYLTALYLSLKAKENRRLLDSCHFNSPDYFYGVSSTGQMNLTHFENVLTNLKEGTTEIMSHPGYIDREWESYPLNREKFYINNDRENEINLLLNPRVKTIIEQQGILLVSYKEL